MVYGWIWISLIFASVLLTLLTKRNLIASVAAGAVVPTVLDLFKVDFVWQVVAFLLGFIAYALVMIRYFAEGPTHRNSFDPSDLVGSRCEVIEEIDNAAGRGLVNVNSESWSARAVVDTDVYSVGESLNVVAVEGVQLICRK